ncbi:MAG: cob(I)yrinic acid a,c-diamide adenosyltransferase [Synergistaceae bacterium]|nr:cob(I)yrinic acid a,c-diamide adenosyltransferase [Synergistaceae bacterium]
MSILDFGLIQVYMGDGKGKTTGALGLVLRMAGCGGRVAFIQFMKGWEYSEVKGLSFLPGVRLVQTGRPDYIYPGKIDPLDYAEAERGLRAAGEAILSGRYDLVVLDEINVALSFGLIPLDRVITLLKSRPLHVEVVLTGRTPPRELVELADLVTDMTEIKHPFSRGILARKGIDC